jgi:hypothetical protein
MQPERPECQCLACAQLQHQQANDTLLLVVIATVLVVAGLVWLTGQLAGLLAAPSAHEACDLRKREPGGPEAPR